MYDDDDEWKPRSRRRPGTKQYGILYRMKASRRIHILPEHFSKWKSWKWYFTEKQRDEALESMNKRDDIFEYAPTER